ncbi:ribosome biogenesis protein Nop53/GLTSCR2 [Myxozyma melibiosi]|uniref:Ribosome biogenesis protein NOP53 n=1 Tax=Myxozyma melibiosi TaxID=54550 RepID=A0ABR1F4C4_9ASCO
MSSKLRAQPSRKGKKAWRKNVDVSEVEQGLEDVREEKILVGTTLDKLDSDKLFAVDDSASSHVPKAFAKPLKADQILAERSAIPALMTRKRAREDEAAAERKKGNVQGVSYKDLARLLRKAGRVADGKSSIANLERDSHIVGDIYDAWGEDQEPSAQLKVRMAQEPEKKGVPNKKDIYAHAKEIGLDKTLSYVRKEKPPVTLSHPPIAFKESRRAVDLPKEGISYNPSLDSWQAILKEEHVKLEKQEKERKREEERQERIRQLGELLEERERLGLDEVDSDAEDEEETQKPVTIKREDEDNTIKKESQPATTSSTTDAPSSPSSSSTKVIDLSKPSRTTRKHKLGKYKVAERPITLKLADELTDSLRLLKPEGNLAKDRFISMQERGVIEARVQVFKGRKYKKNLTEKWSYKDIK